MEKNIYINENIEEITKSIKSIHPNIYNECIEWADETLNGIITHRAHFEMERCLTPVTFNDSVWNNTPPEIENRDPEWNFAFSRHSILLNLAKAFAYTKDEKYKNKFIEILKSFLMNADKNGLSWRSLEGGIRPENWIRSIEIFKLAGNPLSKELISEMKASLKEHIVQLTDAHKAFQRLSNWGIIQDHGLFVASLYLDNPEGINLALERLEEEAYFQVFEDGTHWEQSPLYHIEILHCLVDTIHLARKNNIKVSSILEEKTKAASMALYEMIGSDNHIFMQGDSDYLEADNLLFTAGKLFPELGISVKKQEENFWDFGSEIEDINKEKRKSVYLPDSYNTYLRGKNIEAHIYAGNMGSGHGHISPLHVDINADGKAFIVDSGRLTYTDTKERFELKRLKAHNTVVLDDDMPEEPSGSWSYTAMPLSIKGTTKLKEKYDYTEYTNLSYLQKKTAVRRKLIRLGDDIAVVFDEIISDDNHTVEIPWHLDSNVQIQKEDDSYTLSNGSAKLHMWTSASSSTVENSYMSKHYNEREDNKTIILKESTKGITTTATIFSTIPLDIKKLEISLIDAKRVLTENEGIALELTGDDNHWIVLTRAKEIVAQVDIFKAGSLEGYGMTLIKKNDWKYPEAIF